MEDIEAEEDVIISANLPFLSTSALLYLTQGWHPSSSPAFLHILSITTNTPMLRSRADPAYSMNMCCQ